MNDPSPGSLAGLRRENIRRVEQELRLHGSLTQGELASGTGLSKATISNIVTALTNAGRARASDVIHHGRRAKAISLTGTLGHAVGLDFGRRHVTAVVTTFSREILAEDEVKLGSEDSWQRAVDTAASLVDSVLREAEVAPASVLGVGAGLPGPIDPVSGRIKGTAILPLWADLPVREALQERLNAPVVIENDANLGALGELGWGAAKGAENFAYVKIGAGVGAGLVLNGQLFRGQNGMAGEIGHIVVQRDGLVCRCGNRGCLETIVSADAITNLLHSTHGDGLTATTVIANARAGDRSSTRALHDAGSETGNVVAHLCTLFDVELVIVGGELAYAGELLLGPLRTSINRNVLPRPGKGVEVVSAQLDRRAQALGGAARVLALSSVVDDGPVI